MVLRPSLKRGVPGLGSPLARALFFVALSWFRVAGRFLRGTAMVFCFQTLEIVAEPLGLLLKPLLARLKLPARASPHKIHGCKSLLLQLLDDKVKKQIVRRRAVFCARSFCASRGRDGALCGAALVLLKKRACRRFNFPPSLVLSNFFAKLCF